MKRFSTFLGACVFCSGCAWFSGDLERPLAYELTLRWADDSPVFRGSAQLIGRTSAANTWGVPPLTQPLSDWTSSDANGRIKLPVDDNANAIPYAMDIVADHLDDTVRMRFPIVDIESPQHTVTLARPIVLLFFPEDPDDITAVGTLGIAEDSTFLSVLGSLDWPEGGVIPYRASSPHLTLWAEFQGIRTRVEQDLIGEVWPDTLKWGLAPF
jgi:hypothetical protein